MLTPRRSSSLVRRKFRIGAKAVGSLSINIAPVSSRRVDILPLSKLEKKESGIHIRVCLEVLNLVPPTFSWMISPIPGVRLFPFVAMMSEEKQRLVEKSPSPVTTVRCHEEASLLTVLPPAQLMPPDGPASQPLPGP